MSAVTIDQTYSACGTGVYEYDSLTTSFCPFNHFVSLFVTYVFC